MHESRADLSQAFCSYCGYPPMGRWRSLAHRVCLRCEMGTVLRAPPGLQPRFYEPFVIVDARLRVQAVSHQTEAILKVEEPAVFDVPLAELLMCRTDQDQIDLAGAVGRALAGATTAHQGAVAGSPRSGDRACGARCRVRTTPGRPADTHPAQNTAHAAKPRLAASGHGRRPRARTVVRWRRQLSHRTGTGRLTAHD